MTMCAREIGRIKTTNVDELLGVRERKFIANGRHYRLLACVEIWRRHVGILRVTTAFLFSPEQEQEKKPCDDHDKKARTKFTFGKRRIGRS
jgi:hypothetical protein